MIAANQSLAPFAPPLHGFHKEGTTREACVEAQLQSIRCCDRKEFWYRVKVTDIHSAGWLQVESLAALLHAFVHHGQTENAFDILEILTVRTAGFVDRHVSAAHIPPQHSEDCKRDIEMQMMKKLLTEPVASEFWEVRFWLCLRRLILNVCKEYRRTPGAGFTDNSPLDGEGDSYDTLNQIPDSSTISAFDRIACHEALASLNENERAAFLLYHYHDYSQAEIASHLKVTVRTVYNLLDRATDQLQAWQLDSVH